MEGWISKAWGWFKTIDHDELCVVQRLRIVEGGYSSKHYHKYLNNRMIVLQGMFVIESYHTEDKIAGEELLVPGDQLFIPFERIHRFVARTPVQAIEVVTVEHGEIDLSDIVRFDEGGVYRGK